ncbi:substrate-binding domain-containing protein [soil metagenome]
MSVNRSTLRAILTTTAIAAVASLGLAGCSAGGGGSDDEVIVGYSTYTVSNPAFAGIIKGLQDGADAHGYKLVITDSNLDPNQQVTDVQNLVTQGADYIVITPADAAAIEPGVKAAENAGIPVFAIADTINTEVTATFSMSHEEGGLLAAQEVVEFLTEKYGAPEGKVVNIQGLAGTAAAVGRNDGFVNELANYPDIEIVASQDGGWDTAPANAAMSTILQAQPEIDAVYAANDAEAIGVTAALKDAGRYFPVGDPNHVYLIGVDGAKPAIEDIRAGVQDATVSQNFVKMGTQLVDAIADWRDGTTDKVEDVQWPLLVIRGDNIDSAEVAEYGIWADEVG